MIFPITDLLDDEQSERWLLEYFHPQGLRCPKCGSRQSRYFRQTQTSRLSVYRCLECGGIYNLYSGTVFEKKHLSPAEVVLVLRGVINGQSSMSLSQELGVSRSTVHELRTELQTNAHNLQSLQPDTTLTDEHTETDEMFQNAGEKRGAPKRGAPKRGAPSRP